MRRNWFPPAAARLRYGPPPTLTYTDYRERGSDRTVYTNLACDLGAQQDRRYIVIAVHWDDNTSQDNPLLSVTVGGVPATIIGELGSPASSGDRYDPAVALCFVEYDNANTTADIEMTFTYQCARMAMGVWQMHNGHEIELIDFDTEYLQVTHAGSSSITLDTIEGGVVVYAQTLRDPATTSGYSPLTRRYDDSVDTGKLGAEGLDVSGTPSGATTYGYSTIPQENTTGIAASFR